MQDDVAALFAYDRWANLKVFDACRALTAEQYVAEPVPGWSSVSSTVYHIIMASERNLCAVAGASDAAFPAESEVTTLDAAARLLDQTYRRFDDLRPTLTPERLNSLLTIHPPGWPSMTLPRWAMLRHIVNHATYHRGQIASKLKRLGIDPPNTDFFFWSIEQIPQQSG